MNLDITHILECDGACEPRNPGGTGAWGFILRCNDVDYTQLYEDSGSVEAGPTITNNAMEYLAVTKGLNHLWMLTREVPPPVGQQSHLLIHADSKLVIEQLAGRWRVNGGLYFPYYQRAKMALDTLRPRLGQITLRWVRREENAAADGLCRQALAEAGVVIPQSRQITW
jgi:ribonuclease HI